MAVDYFKLGDNLVRRVKSARPPDGILYRDFAIVSRTK